MSSIETIKEKEIVEDFLKDVENCDFWNFEDWRSKQEQLLFLTSKLIDIVIKHTVLKMQLIRGNQIPFVTRNVTKEIYTRSRSRNRFCKDL